MRSCTATREFTVGLRGTRKKYTKIIIQCGLGNRSSYIGKGEMVAAFNDVPPVGRFRETYLFFHIIYIMVSIKQINKGDHNDT